MGPFGYISLTLLRLDLISLTESLVIAINYLLTVIYIVISNCLYLSVIGRRELIYGGERNIHECQVNPYEQYMHLKITTQYP